MTLMERVTEVLAGHLRDDHEAGNGYTEPRESWITCSCGADIWHWQQFYNETEEDPEENWRAHQAAALSALIQEVEADAWDKGCSDGRGYIMARGDARRLSKPLPPILTNPYRADKLEGKGG